MALIDATRMTQGLTLRQVEEEIGVSAKPIRRLRGGAGVDALTLMRIMMWLGVTNIATFAKKTPQGILDEDER